ncbi:uncharacterized protein [Ptychodera flava]|uniref:uncharacterized protein n=1 Tax=Ptychodera flava TaxID=63121 RepID=UPI003969C062
MVCLHVLHQVLQLVKKHYVLKSELKMAQKIHPLRTLYNTLNRKLGTDKEKEIKDLLTGRQLYPREVEKLDNVTAIFLCLEDKGFISQTDLSFIKTILTRIEEPVLVEDVLKCEKELGIYKDKARTGRTDKTSGDEPDGTTPQRQQGQKRTEWRGRQKRLKCYKILFWITGAVSVSVAIITISIFRGAYGCPLQNTGQRVWLAILTTTYMSAVVCMVILLLCAAERISCEVLRNKEVTSTIVSVIATIVAGTIFVAMLTGDCFTIQEKTNPYTSTSPFPSLSSTGLNETS